MHKKSFWALTVVSLFILLVPAGRTEITITDIQCNTPSSSPFIEKNNSYIGENIGENTNWYVVELHSNQTINISELYIKIEANETGTQWLSASRFIIINFENKKFWTPPMEVWAIGGKYLEWYLQINTGGLNFTCDHLYKKANGKQVSTYSLHNISLSAGTWYLIALKASTVECKITAYINGTNAEIGGINYGSNAFLIENEGFLAKFNLKTALLSIIFDGRKTFHINNTFVGFVYFNLGFGKASVEYKSPEGETGKCEMWSTFKEVTISNDSTFYPVFTPITGGKGEWTFYTSMAAVGVGNTVDLLAADIKLP